MKHYCVMLNHFIKNYKFKKCLNDILSYMHLFWPTYVAMSVNNRRIFLRYNTGTDITILTVPKSCANYGALLRSTINRYFK